MPSVADMNRSAEDTTISRFHIGEAIKIQWQAPVTHSKRDWIGVRPTHELLVAIYTLI